MDKIKYSNIYSFCDVCNAKIDAPPYSLYCCDSCYQTALNDAVQEFTLDVDNERRHYGIMKNFCSIYGVELKDIEIIKLQPSITTLKELENEPHQICGFYYPKDKRHSLIYVHLISLKVACNFAIDGLLKRKILLLKYKEL